MIEEIMKKMIDYSNGNLHDINHFVKVHSYARLIACLEGLDEETMTRLEIAAIIHDIACPLCREKYGNTNGEHQEKEGKALAAEFLKEFNLSKELEERVVYLVSHHHTYNNVDGMDYQILLEADFLVNADEMAPGREAIMNFRNKVFKTQAGIHLLESMYTL